MRLLIFGPPGAGKGTQAKMISEKYNIHHIASGDLLRTAVANKTALGLKAKEYMDKGELVPDGLMIDLIREVLKGDSAKNGFILDGFPRTVAQAEALDSMLNELGMPIEGVISLDVDQEKILQRFADRRTCRSCLRVYSLSELKAMNAQKCPQCGGELYLRDDDNHETVRRRMDVYLHSTQPVKDYFKKKGIYKEMDGMNEIRAVFGEITKDRKSVV